MAIEVRNVSWQAGGKDPIKDEFTIRAFDSMHHNKNTSDGYLAELVPLGAQDDNDKDGKKICFIIEPSHLNSICDKQTNKY